MSPTVNIQGPKTGLGYGSASVVIDKLGRLYTAGSAENLGFVYIWAASSNGDTTPTASLHVGGNVPGYPMVLTFDRSGDLWVASSNEGGGFINEYAQFPLMPMVILLTAYVRCAQSMARGRSASIILYQSRSTEVAAYPSRSNSPTVSSRLVTKELVTFRRCSSYLVTKLNSTEMVG